MNIIQSLKLFLPAIFPSWNFFDIISPSPRIEYALFSAEDKEALNWVRFRPRENEFSYSNLLKTLFWNSKWNESLFLVSCAERIIDKYTPHSENEIFKRIEKELMQTDSIEENNFLQFRLVFIQRNKDKLEKEILFTSLKHKLSMQNHDH